MFQLVRLSAGYSEFFPLNHSNVSLTLAENGSNHIAGLEERNRKRHIGRSGKSEVGVSLRGSIIILYNHAWCKGTLTWLYGIPMKCHTPGSLDPAKSVVFQICTFSDLHLFSIAANRTATMGERSKPEGSSWPKSTGWMTGGQFLRLLTGVQNTSALVFSVFLTVHLASPLAAATGGGSLADKTLVSCFSGSDADECWRRSMADVQLIGRDLYLPLEPLLVYAPLSLHLAASTIKRAYLTYWTRSSPPLTIHLVTGWLLIPFLLPHILTHRITPQSPSPPISSLSPSELNFEFVAYSLYTRPVQSGLAYLALVGLAVPHAVLGGMKVVSWIKRIRAGERTDKVQETPRRTGIPRKRKIMAGWMLEGLLDVVLIGLVRLYYEGAHVGAFMAKRYEAVFEQTAWTRFGLR